MASNWRQLLEALEREVETTCPVHGLRQQLLSLLGQFRTAISNANVCEGQPPLNVASTVPEGRVAPHQSR